MLIPDLAHAVLAVRNLNRLFPEAEVEKVVEVPFLTAEVEVVEVQFLTAEVEVEVVGVQFLTADLPQSLEPLLSAVLSLLSPVAQGCLLAAFVSVLISRVI